MKKLSRRYKAVLLFRARDRLRRRRRAPSTTEGKAEVGIAYGIPTSIQVVERGDMRLIQAPGDFSLTTNHDGVADFMDAVRAISRPRERGARYRRVLDLSTIEQIGVGAAIILAAEADRWRRLLGVRTRPYRPDTWKPQVRLVVQALGIFELLGPKALDAYELTSDLVMIPLRSGVGSVNVGKLANDFLVSLVDLVGPLKARPAYYDGLCEAILNAAHHAYEIELRPPSSPTWLAKRWWAAGSYDKSRKELFVAIYDQGVGIPRTLPKSKVWSTAQLLLRSASGSASDGDLIAAALQSRVSRTDKAERGEGLAQLADLVNETGNGYLRILSGRGEVVYDGEEFRVEHHDRDLGGTLIAWQLGLGTKADENEDD